MHVTRLSNLPKKTQLLGRQDWPQGSHLSLQTLSLVGAVL